VKYIPFGPSAKDDLILCILLAALADVAGKSNITLLEKSCKLGFCIEFETGARVRIILLRGTYPDRAPAELHAHIWIHMEDAARDIPVIIVIPCAPGMPEISDTELPQQYLNRSALPGQAKPEISFIPADYLFNSVSYEQLLSVLTKFVVASEVSDDVQ